MRGDERRVATAVAQVERKGLPFVQALFAVMLDPGRFHQDRAPIGKLLSVDGDDRAVKALLELFERQTEKDDLYVTALTVEHLNDQRAVGPLIHALLHDNNGHRRHAAARALGWISPPSRAAALALAQCLCDPSQPQPAREEAAESLAYAGNRETIGALISVLQDPDVRLRFWAVFGLGQSCRGEPRAIRALESMLGDKEVPPGNWWAVGKEALGVLGHAWKPIADYTEKLEAETERILADPSASPQHRWWAEYYTSRFPE